MREHADEDQRELIEEVLTPPNQWDAVRQAPVWWTDDEEAWSAFANAPRV